MQDFRGSADLLVNTTPVGQHPNVDASPLSETQLHFELVYDLVYNPEETKLIRQARYRGCKTISGIEMFLEQAARQFLAWTGRDPDRGVMRDLIAESP
jgi:3-dehydroquinate dehydratase/shikimate dehydrogenase